MNSSDTRTVSGLISSATSDSKMDRVDSIFRLIRRLMMLRGFSFAINCLNLDGVTTTGIVSKCG